MNIPPRSERFSARGDSAETLYGKIRSKQDRANSPELESLLASPSAQAARDARHTHRALADSTSNMAHHAVAGWCGELENILSEEQEHNNPSEPVETPTTPPKPQSEWTDPHAWETQYELGRGRP